jgi:hypothetical protein
MQTRRLAPILLVAAALAAAPLSVASAHTTASHKAHAGFAVSKLTVVGHDRTYDVATAGVSVKVRVQVKDFSKKFDPASVTLSVAEKESGTPASTFTVSAHRVGKSHVVSNWHATITVPQGAVAPGTQARYCVSLVKVNPDNTDVLPVVAKANHLPGRDCFTVVNTATA